MILKIFSNYSPNFNPIKRKLNQIKFLVFHYTGMRNDFVAIEKLTNARSNVSCHYFVKKNGEILNLVPDLYTAWHAGKSSWKKFKSLNRYSIGIEISNPGHDHGYRKFSSKQISSIVKLLKFLIKKYNIKKKNILGHSDIAPNRKKDPGEKFPWKYLAENKIGYWHSIPDNLLKKNRQIKVCNIDKKLFFKNLNRIGYSEKCLKNFNKTHNSRFIIKAFQRRFRQQLVNGLIDRECLIISNNLLKKYC